MQRNLLKYKTDRQCKYKYPVPLSDSDSCISLPCLNNGTCFDLKKGYGCFCPSSYYGQNCENKVEPEVDYCKGNPCNNRGTCYNVTGTYLCACAEGFLGRTAVKVFMFNFTKHNSHGSMQQRHNLFLKNRIERQRTNKNICTSSQHNICVIPQILITAEAPLVQTMVNATMATTPTTANVSLDSLESTALEVSVTDLIIAKSRSIYQRLVCVVSFTYWLITKKYKYEVKTLHHGGRFLGINVPKGFLFLLPHIPTVQKCILTFSAVQCPVPEQGVEATLGTANRTYHVMETANYTCNNNTAVISGSLSIQCQTSGQWSDSPPVCGM